MKKYVWIFLVILSAFILFACEESSLPVADAGGDQTVSPGSEVILDGSGSYDPDNDPLTYLWTLASPEGSNAVLSDATIVNPTFTADVEGIYVARLVVNDGAWDSQPSITMINASDGPVIEDVEGFYEFEESTDTRKVFVSSSLGSDQNSGLSEDQPVATISKGISLLRDGYPDWLLLRKGDTWDESFGQWTLSGRSASEPMVVASWGSPGSRPLLQTGVDAGLYTSGGGGSPEIISHLVLSGIYFHAHTRDPESPAFQGSAGSAGISWLRGTQGLHIEDCVFDSYGVGLSIEDYDGFGIQNLILHRDIIIDSYGTAGVSHSQGVYLSGVDTALISECIFDHNGWNDNVSGANPTIFNHNIYIQYDCSNVFLKGNIVMRGASHGAQLRPGGVAYNNLFVRNAIGLLLGTSENITVDATALNNVLLEGTDIDTNNIRGWGIDLENINSAQVMNNLLANEISVSDDPLNIDDDPNTSYVGNIVYNWGSGRFVSAGPFLDPNRSVVTYNAVLGNGATFEAFATELRKQSRDNWRPEYTAEVINAYIREGFATP